MIFGRKKGDLARAVALCWIDKMKRKLRGGDLIITNGAGGLSEPQERWGLFGSFSTPKVRLQCMGQGGGLVLFHCGLAPP